MSRRVQHTNHAKHKESSAKHKGTPAKHKPKPKERGALLTILLVLVILNGAILTLVSWQDARVAGEVTMPIILGLFIVSSIAHVVAGIALWTWKRWGLALYGIAAAVTGVLGIINTGSLIVLMGALVPFAVVGYVVRMKWKMFE